MKLQLPDDDLRDLAAVADGALDRGGEMTTRQVAAKMFAPAAWMVEQWAATGSCPVVDDSGA